LCLLPASTFLVLLAAVSGSIAPAQTAHLSQAQIILNLPSPLDYPQGVAIDGSGNLYVADAYHGRVLKLTPSGGGFVQSTVGTGLQIPYGVAVDASGTVYIADIMLSTLLKETPSGSGYTQTTIGSGLYDAVSVAVDGSGNVYAVEVNNSFVGTLLKETLSGGTYTQSFIPAGGSQGVYKVAADSSGDLFVSDGWTGTLVELTPQDGVYLPTTLYSGGAGAVALDSKGDIYIPGTPLGAITELIPSAGGYTQNIIQTNGTNTTYGYFGPQGVAVDGNGNVFFTDGYTYELVEEAMANPNAGQMYIGGTSYPVSMFFTFDTGGAIAGDSVVTQGAASLDFTDAGTGTCYATYSYGQGSSCYVDVYFSPAAPGLRSGAAILNGGTGDPIAIGYVQGTGTGPEAAFPGAAPSTNVSGLNVPLGMAVDAAGDRIIANSNAKNVVFVAAGGAQSPVGSGFTNPTGVAIDGAGNIFVADNNSAVYEVAASTGVQTQLNIAGLSGPEDLAVDGAGNLYISEPNASTVLKVTPTGAQSTVGIGLSSPRGMTSDAAGNLYITDYVTGNVNKVTPSGAQTSVGGFGGPSGVAVDAAGDIFVSVFGTGTLVEVAPNGTRTTLASGLADPYDVALDASGNLYFTEYVSGLVRKIDRADAPSFSFATTVHGETSSDSPRTAQVANIGNQPLTFTGLSYPTDFPEASGDANACSTAAGLSAAQECDLPIDFTPQSTGSLSEDVTLTDNSLNGSGVMQQIAVSGTGLAHPLSQTIAFTPVPTGQVAAASVNLSASATSGLPVSFTSLTPSVCTVSGNTASLISYGFCTIRATQAGDGLYAAAPAVSQTFGIGHASQTISFAPIAGQVAATSVNLSATATSGLAVSFASLTPSVCTVSGSSATLISYGFCTIQATQPGNGEYSTAPAVDQSFGVGHAAQTISFSPIAGQVAATNVNLSATATSGLAVSFTSLTPSICTVSGTTASLISYGFCTIQATQAGNSEYFAAPTVSQTFGVGHASQTISFTPVAAGQVAATNVNLSATATSGLAVSFTSLTPAICTVSGSTASLISYGFCTIQATQAGNSEYLGAPPVDQTFGVGHASQTISFTPIAGQVAATNVNLAATATSGLTVSFTSLTPSICTVSGSTASLISYGFCTIQATQAGNSEYLAAPAVDQSFGVGHATQTISFAPIAGQTVGTPLNLTATATSGLTVSFASLTPSVCTVSGTTASMNSAGSCTIQASQAGNNEYFAAPAVNRTFAVAN
jgi:sugar lactone lactonase YvrE